MQNCLNPTAILMLFVAASCLLGWGYPGYKNHDGFFWLIWLFVGILAVIAWVTLVAS